MTKAPLSTSRHHPFWQTAGRHAVLIALSLVFLTPLFWLVSSSLKTDAQLLEPVESLRQWLPRPLTLENYDVRHREFRPPFWRHFWRYLGNTLTICALSVLGTLLSCSLVAFGLSHLRWRGRDALFYLLLGTMMLPGQVTMVPLFVIFAKLGWVDTFLPLTVPHFFGAAFYIFLMRQFFLSIPRELIDAAQIDGCSYFDIYRRIVLPLSRPVLATVGLFTFLGAWNDYLGPLIYLADERKYTLSLGLATFQSQYGSYVGMMMAATTIMTLPIIVLFFFTQRTFIQGMTTSGLKG
jgi:multiple sugar transport system permease protein